MSARPAARHVTGSREVSVQDTAARMMVEAQGDVALAKKKMRGYISSFPRMIDDVLDVGISTLLYRVPSIENAANARAAQEAAPAKAPFKMNAATKIAQQRIARIGASAAEALLNIKHTINGRQAALRDFTGDEVRRHGEELLLAGRERVRNAHYLIWVGEAAGDSKVDNIDPDVIVAFRKKADQLA